MMTPVAVPTLGSYGAIELKHDYRKNMFLAVLIAASLHLCVVGGILLFRTSLTDPAEPETKIIIIEGETHLEPLPPITYDDPTIRYAEPLAKLTAGMPVPWPDAEVSEDPYFPTKNDLARYSAVEAQKSPSKDGAAVVIKSPVVDGWPLPTEFVSVEEMPVLIYNEPPAFPEMAELTGQSGIVWIQALIDREGHVQKAQVVKPSGTNVGFEDEAVKAAYLNLYKPAIQNGRPVPVWITYRVVFKLR